MINHAELTEFGQLFAEANAEQSIVARVALGGYDTSWPASHVHAAIEACNAKGESHA